MEKNANQQKTHQNRGFWAKKWQFLLVLAFAAILSIGIWGRMDKVMTGDDYAFHVARLQSASHAWSNGQLIPQVDPDALGGFGYAYNLFYGPLVTYVASGLQVLIQNWAITINLILILALALSGLTMCYAVTKMSKNRAIGALAGIFYMATPYVLTDLYLRVALGESLAFIAAPILLLGLYQLTAKQRNATRSLAIAASLLILSHSLSALLFAMMAGVYVLLNIDKLFNWKSIWRAALAVLVTLGLTAIFILPLIETKISGGADYGIYDASYVAGYFGADAGNMNAHRMWPARMFFDFSFRHADGSAVGLVAIFGLVGFFMIWRKLQAKQDRRFVLSLFILAVLALVLMTPAVDWNYVPEFFYKFQFPWRLLEVVALTTSVLAAYTIGVLMRGLADEKQRVAALVMGILAIMPVAGIFLPSSWDEIEGGELSWEDTSSGNVGWQAEYAPAQMLCSRDNPEEKNQDYKCSLEKIDQLIKERGTDAKVLAGEVKLAQEKKDGLNFEFEVKNNSEDTARIELPLIYYPGYEAWLGDEELELEVSEDLGLVVVVVPAGADGKVEVSYGVSVPTQAGAMLTLITAGVGVVWLVFTGIGDARVRKKETEIVKLMDSVRDVIDEEEDVEAVLTKEVEKAIAADKAEPKSDVEPLAPEKATPKTTKKSPAKSSAKKTTIKTSTKKAAATKTKTTATKTKASAKVTSLTDSSEDSKITRMKAKPRARKDPE